MEYNKEKNEERRDKIKAELKLMGDELELIEEDNGLKAYKNSKSLKKL
jgi:hypothetical protein